MRFHNKTGFAKMTSAKMTPAKLTFILILAGGSVAGFAQNRTAAQVRPNVSYQGYRILNDSLRCSAQGHYPGSPTGAPCYSIETNFAAINDAVRGESQQSSTYRELVERQRIRAAQEAAIRSRTNEDGIRWYEETEPQSQANPDAPDQSELLKNSRDRDFILHNFRTMYVDARDAKYFGSDQMKAALGKNKEFEKLNIRIVDDRRVADVVLTVSYTFAWDFPFELMHQNTTIVLLSGKGEGPFSGPLGAADVARNFVNVAKPWREVKKATGK
jgi:hypothetical protein